MAVKSVFYSDLDPKKTMFEGKKEAEEYDRKLECVSSLHHLLMATAKAHKVNLNDDDLYKVVEDVVLEQGEQLIEIVSGKRPRKSRGNSVPESTAAE